MKIKDSGEQITLDLFQNCDVPEEINITFDPEVDLNDDLGTSGFILFAVIMQETENLSLHKRSPSRVGCLWRNFHPLNNPSELQGKGTSAKFVSSS